MRSKLGLVLVAVVSASCAKDGGADGVGESAKALPPLDAAAAKTANEAIASAESSMRPAIAAAALVELEAARFDASFIDGLRALSQAPPEMRSQLLAKTISDNLSLVDDACEGDARDMMKELATMDPAGRRAHLAKACNFARLGLADAAALDRADPMMSIIAHTMYARVKAAGDVDPNEKQLFVLLLTPAEAP